MTNITLSKQDKEMLDGENGVAAQIAMKILIRMAEIQGATHLIDIKKVHIGGSIFTAKGSLKVLEILASYDAKVRVPTTINSISIDRKRWKNHSINEEFAENADRLASAFEKIGAQPIFSCVPYVYPNAPELGDHLVWAESNAIAYSNSILGARTNRHGDFLDVCAAITGRAPYAGLHVDENRLGNFLVKLPDLNEQDLDISFYTVLGYLIGKHAGEDIPVIEGIKTKPTIDQMKAFSSTISTAGSVGLYHMIGVTPEAKTKEQAFGGKEPKRILNITKEELTSVWGSLSTGNNSSIDGIVLGSPHFLLSEFETLATLVEGKKKIEHVDFLITTNRLSYEQAKEQGFIDKIYEFGARIATDTCLCMLNENTYSNEVKTMMTDSGKFAHYGPGLVNKGIYYGSIKDCVNSAVTGKPVVESPKWLE